MADLLKRSPGTCLKFSLSLSCGRCPSSPHGSAARLCRLGDRCLLVHLNTPLEVCQQRDPSGIYAANVEGTIPGVSFPYEAPTDADLVLNTAELDLEGCVEQVVGLLRERKLI